MKVLLSEINLIKLTNFLDYLTANGTFFFCLKLYKYTRFYKAFSFSINATDETETSYAIFLIGTAISGSCFEYSLL